MGVADLVAVAFRVAKETAVDSLAAAEAARAVQVEEEVEGDFSAGAMESKVAEAVVTDLTRGSEAA